MINAPETVIRAHGLEADDSLCHVSWRARRGSFVSLMTLYESSYIRLGWLISNLEAIDGEHISTARGDCPLHLRVEDRSRYTTNLNLTYYFDMSDESLASAAVVPNTGTPSAGTRVAEPDLQIRVYHDARLAEVRQCSRWHRHDILKALDTRTFGRRGAESEGSNKRPGARESATEVAHHLNDRWLRNMMLNKWLEYCVERGHSF